MRIAVFGTGGVGGYFGGRLAQAGEEVVFIARDGVIEQVGPTGELPTTAVGRSHTKSLQLSATATCHFERR